MVNRGLQSSCKSHTHSRHTHTTITQEGTAAGWLVGYSAVLAIERLRVRIPARAAGEFSFLESTSCADSLSGVRSTPVLSQWHIKDPGHSAKSAGGRLHLNTHTPSTNRSRSGLTIPLSRHSAETYQETSSHATRKGTRGHSRLSSLSHCGLILA